MTAVPTQFAGPIASAADALVRDGLAEFDASLFLDPKLRGTGVLDLLNEADFIRYQSAQPRALKGIHAALGIEEATIIVVPDAVQWGWRPRPPQPRPIPGTSAPAPKPAFERFLECGTRVPQTPVLSATEPDAIGSFTLTWTGAAGDRFVLQEATAADFSDAVMLQDGVEQVATLYGRAPGDYFYRVQACSGNVRGDWSNGVLVRVAPETGYEQMEAYSPATLLEVQRALLRMCAARGDLFALLALSAEAREDDAVRHVRRLKEPDELGYGDAASYSYGALYHPWLVSRDEEAPELFRRTPPDGAAAGILARRALARGAWIAPANEPLHGVLTLSPALGPPVDDEQGINRILQEPRGFLSLSADTLSDDEDFEPIGVRRLLILLRRLALRRGVPLVFEPNSDAFRRRVQSVFTDMLNELFRRGAFAGRTPATSYQVVAGASLNTAQSVEQGRFIVELRVAPSQPLKFLTIRLLQSGDRGVFVEAS
jgi:hypothetical protein